MSIKKLKNGLRYYVNNNKGSSSVSVYFLVNVGSIDEKEGGYGLAHFLEHMLFKGTKRRLKSKNLTNNIYKLGAETNAFTSFAMTGYYINASYDYLENVLDILSDMLYNSTFTDLIKERDVVISENKKAHNIISRITLNLLYMFNRCSSYEFCLYVTKRNFSNNQLYILYFFIPILLNYEIHSFT